MVDCIVGPLLICGLIGIVYIIYRACFYVEPWKPGERDAWEQEQYERRARLFSERMDKCADDAWERNR